MKNIYTKLKTLYLILLGCAYLFFISWIAIIANSALMFACAIISWATIVGFLLFLFYDWLSKKEEELNLKANNEHNT